MLCTIISERPSINCGSIKEEENAEERRGKEGREREWDGEEGMGEKKRTRQ